MNAPKSAPDPWENLDPATIVVALREKGWPAHVGSWGVELDLSAEPGGFALLVTLDVEGEAAFKAICKAHPGAEVDGPRWRSNGRVTRVVRQGVEGLPSCDLVPGVSIVADGRAPIPPNTKNNAFLRWMRPAHAATTEPEALPPWVALVARPGPAQDAARIVAARAVLAVQSKASAPASSSELPDANAWELQLVRSGRGVKNTHGNLCKIFRLAPEFAGKLRLNTMTQAVEFAGKPMPEEQVGQLRERVEDAPWGGFAPGKDALFDAVYTVAAERKYHPVQEYLSALVWDGTPRIERVLTEVLRAKATPLHQSMIRKWFISAVARAVDPGCKVDTALILLGLQGLFKSSFFTVLAGAWFADTEVKIGDKDGYQQIHASWITEWGEIDRVTGQRHAGEVKAFIARRADLFRPPYGRIARNFLRACVIVGSSNNEELLTDPTGSRRFWCIPVHLAADLELLADLRDQLWAEAVAAYGAGERWYLDADEDAAREDGAERHRVRDIWEDELEAWIAGPWEAIKGETGRNHITTFDLVTRALKIPARDCKRDVENRVGAAMRALKYTAKRVRLRPEERDLYRDSKGGTKPLLRAWVPNEVLTSDELRGADEIEFEAPVVMASSVPPLAPADHTAESGERSGAWGSPD